MSQAKVIKVIETEELKGNGSEKNPYRRIKQFWTLKGAFIMENDEPHMREKINQLSYDLGKERKKNETKP